MDVFLGQILLVAFNYAPQGFALCNGQILSISQNTALFSLLGTYYGGNGSSTFALPNLQGSIPVNIGQGSGLTPYTIGQTGGFATVTLTSATSPSHSHAFMGTTAEASSPSPASALYAVTSAGRGHGTPYYATSNSSPSTLNPSSLAVMGGSQPHSNMMPYLVMNWVIALEGIYPQRQ
jgi:microcystin-dependent protein